MAKRKRNWIVSLINFIFSYRYAFVLCFISLNLFLGYILYAERDWGFKDAAQVCTGFFIVVTLFFAALNYEFTYIKTKRDAQLARETLTFTTASEWHKSPIKDYQKTSIQHERIFIASTQARSAEDFEKYFEDINNLEFKESLKGIFNFFETISIGAYKGLIDKEFIREFYNGIFRIYYIDYYFYIAKHRILRNNPTIWVTYTSLVEEWHDSLNGDVISGKVASTIINS